MQSYNLIMILYNELLSQVISNCLSISCSDWRCNYLDTFQWQSKASSVLLCRRMLYFSLEEYVFWRSSQQDLVWAGTNEHNSVCSIDIYCLTNSIWVSGARKVNKVLALWWKKSQLRLGWKNIYQLSRKVNFLSSDYK